MGATIPDLVRDLLRPEAYAVPAAAPVQLCTTHASWVFLVGNEAWKVKRPVRFSFLDFWTVDARRDACEEEVRLNRRLAPDVYLGVAPVRRTPTGHALHGDGPIVDWAVHMRRLPDDASAEALLGRGALDARALEPVAARLAEFFAQARPTPAFGTVAALRRNVEENFDEVAPFVGDLLDEATFDEVRAFQRRALGQGEPRFAARVAEARIREGHGDLRLEHVYLDPGPVIIDCIEFCERFRCDDTAAEIAFLAMELEAAGRPDLAAGFVARYAEASDDFGLYGVLDFYLSYRAWVRGKVAGFVAADAAASPEVRARKREEARRQFGLARSFSGRPLDRPFLVVVGGVIGSGKSTLAAALGRALAAPVVGSDPTRKRLAGLAPTARGGAALYDAEQTERTYAELLRRASIVLGAGRGVILDATFFARRWRQAGAEIARATDADLAFIEARCARPEVLRARLAGRRQVPSVSDATDDLLDDFLQRYEPPGPSDPGPRFVVDTGDAPEAALRDAMRGLESAGILPAADRRVS